MNPEQLASAYLAACAAELAVRKPGNVSIHAAGHDMTAEDFIQSASVSAPHLMDSRIPLGARIEAAVRATRQKVGCNTNLGILLVCAPLLDAALRATPERSWRTMLADTLARTTREDAAAVFRAIVHAAPGGLGEAPEQDVRTAPAVNLLEAMRLAAHRDRIARQYVAHFTDVFDIAQPAYRAALAWNLGEPRATLAAFVALLGAIPDSHVERKYGTRHTQLIQRRAREISAVLRAPDARLAACLDHIDREFKTLGINPGTTADLTVACLLAARLDTLARTGRPMCHKMGHPC